MICFTVNNPEAEDGSSVRRGLVQVYTGEGKGKTTAALGLALRACGHGWKVLMIQFMKGGTDYGEIRTAGSIPGLTLIQTGSPDFVTKRKPSGNDLNLAARGMDMAREALKTEPPDMLILDEINVAVDYGLVTLDRVLELIRCRPPHMELVLTGRYAHPELIRIADLVSEIGNIKHPFAQGVSGRRGMEY